jgi:hypothetical protein
MEAVVHLELLLEAEGLLIEERTAHASSPRGKIGFAPPRSKSRNASAVPFGPCAEAELCSCSLQNRACGSRQYGCAGVVPLTGGEKTLSIIPFCEMVDEAIFRRLSHGCPWVARWTTTTSVTQP